MTGIATRIPSLSGLPKTVEKTVDRRPNPSQGGGGGASAVLDSIFNSVVVVPAVSTQLLPDGAQASTAGKGFTCTGLSRRAAGGWYIGNHGKPLASTAGTDTYNCSIVMVSTDGKTKLGEINVASIFGVQSSLQGVAQFSDGTVAAALVEAGRIIYTNDAGANLGGFAYTGANAICVISDTQVAVSPGTAVVQLRGRDGTPGVFLPAAPDIIDHLFYFNGYLFASGNTGIIGQIYAYKLSDGTAGTWKEILRLPLSAAPEGFVIDAANQAITMVSDGYYHQLGTLLNDMQVYSIPKLFSSNRANLAKANLLPNTDLTSSVWTGQSAGTGAANPAITPNYEGIWSRVQFNMGSGTTNASYSLLSVTKDTGQPRTLSATAKALSASCSVVTRLGDIPVTTVVGLTDTPISASGTPAANSYQYGLRGGAPYNTSQAADIVLKKPKVEEGLAVTAWMPTFGLAYATGLGTMTLAEIGSSGLDVFGNAIAA